MDQLKIEHLFKKHYRVYCLLSYSYVSQWDVAEDIVQDVFVKILTKPKTTRILNLNAYIYKAIKNSSLKHIGRNMKLESIDQKSWEIPHLEVVPTEDNNRVAILHKSINKLPLGCKKVFELCALEGYKYGSAAVHLGISVNTVKTQMKKAYKILRSDLKNYYLFILFFIEN